MKKGNTIKKLLDDECEQLVRGKKEVILTDEFLERASAKLPQKTKRKTYVPKRMIAAVAVVLLILGTTLLVSLSFREHPSVPITQPSAPVTQPAVSTETAESTPETDSEAGFDQSLFTPDVSEGGIGSTSDTSEGIHELPPEENPDPPAALVLNSLNDIRELITLANASDAEIETYRSHHPEAMSFTANELRAISEKIGKSDLPKPGYFPTDIKEFGGTYDSNKDALDLVYRVDGIRYRFIYSYDKPKQTYNGNAVGKCAFGKYAFDLYEGDGCMVGSVYTDYATIRIVIYRKIESSITVCTTAGSTGEFAADLYRPEGYHQNIGSALALMMHHTPDSGTKFNVLICPLPNKNIVDILPLLDLTIDLLQEVVVTNDVFADQKKYHLRLNRKQIRILAENGFRCMYIGSGIGEYKDINWDTVEGIKTFCEIWGDRYTFRHNTVSADPDIWVDGELT